jgi:hypothetical protein
VREGFLEKFQDKPSVDSLPKIKFRKKY